MRVKDLEIMVNGVALVRCADLTIQPGETVVVTGQSGAGKSLFLSTLAGLMSPRTQDTVHYAGDLCPFEHSSFIHQDSLGALNPVMRCDAQLRIVCGRDPLPALQACGIDSSTAHRYPLQLSGGQRQRVAIAQAMACSPEAIYADEPTSSLDPVTTLSILDALCTARDESDSALVIATHERSLPRLLAARHIRIIDGEVVE